MAQAKKPTAEPKTFTEPDPFKEAQTDGPHLAAVLAPLPDDPNDIEYYEDYNPDEQGQQTLGWRDGVDHSPFQTRFFRYDEMPRLNGTVRSGYWRPLKKDLEMFGLCMGDLFVEQSDPAYPFDMHGLIPYGRNIKSPDGREVRECYLAVRPAKAFEAEQKVRARESAKAVSKKHQESGRDAANEADKIAKKHYGLAQDTAPQVVSSLTSFDQEMRKNMITSGQYDKLRR